MSTLPGPPVDVHEHWELLAAGSAVVFAVGFLTVRFSLDWLDRRVEHGGDVSQALPGPSWAERPADTRGRVHIPPRMG